jgi:hypothetical protein
MICPAWTGGAARGQQLAQREPQHAGNDQQLNRQSEPEARRSWQRQDERLEEEAVKTRPVDCVGRSQRNLQIRAAVREDQREAVPQRCPAKQRREQQDQREFGRGTGFALAHHRPLMEKMTMEAIAGGSEAGTKTAAPGRRRRFRHSADL